MAINAPQLEAFVDPDYSGFLRPGKMADKVKEYCLATNQKVPQNEGGVIRAVLQGIALRYRFVIEKIEEVTRKKAACIHIVGGGTKNRLLSQFTADCLNRLVITGPEEATAIGNLMVQMIASGDVQDSKEGVAIIRNSFKILEFKPGNQQPWDQAYEIFLNHQEMIKRAF
jgi:sugar (pentulose or hexulose) kinase